MKKYHLSESAHQSIFSKDLSSRNLRVGGRSLVQRRQKDKKKRRCMKNCRRKLEIDC